MAQGKIAIRVQSILTTEVFEKLKQALKSFDRTKDFKTELGPFFSEYYDNDKNKKLDEYDRFYIPLDLLFKEKDYESLSSLYSLLLTEIDNLSVEEKNRIIISSYKNYSSLDPLSDEKLSTLFIMMSNFITLNEKSTPVYFAKLSLLVEKKISANGFPIAILYDLNNYLKPEFEKTLIDYMFVKRSVLKSFKNSSLSYMWYSFAYPRVMSLNNDELMLDFTHSLELFLKSDNAVWFNLFLTDLVAKRNVEDNNKDKAMLHCFVLLLKEIKKYYKYILEIKKDIFEEKESPYPLAKKFLFEDIEVAVFQFLSDPNNYYSDETIKPKSLKKLFSQTLTEDYSVFENRLNLKVSNSKKTYIDIMFENIDVYNQALSGWYDIFVHLNKDEGFYEKDKFFKLVRSTSTQQFLQFQYDKDKSNALMLKMSQFVDFKPEQIKAFFADIEAVFAPENHENLELMKRHCLEISTHLSQHLLDEFVSALAPESANKLAEIFADMKCVSVSNSVLMKKLKNDHAPKTVFENQSKVAPFTKTLWKNYSSSIEMQYLTAQSTVAKPLNELVEYTRSLHRFHPSSERSNAGATKYDNLVRLLKDLSEVKGDAYEERLEAAKVLLEGMLNTKPEDSDLLKNRGGFFGAYKTYSRCMNAVGFKHFAFKHGDTVRTAESTTDHLLMTIYDEICAKTKKVIPEEDPEHLDYSSISR